MGGPSPPQAYQPQNTGYADTQTAANLGLQSGQAQTANTLAGNVVNNPYSGSVIPGAQAAGSYLTGTLAPQLQTASTNLSGAAGAALPAGQQLLTTGFDPQQALYNRTAQQVADAQQAALASSGVANTPYGAGVAGQTASNFNIDWQNQQLARQQQALAGYDANLGSVGTAQGQAGALGTGAGEALTTGSALPYSTYNSMQGAGLGAEGAASQIAGAAGQTGQNYLNYTNQAYQNQLAQYQAEQAARSSMFGGLGALFGGAFDMASSPSASLFGSSLWGGGGASGAGGLAGVSSDVGSLVPLIALA